MEMVIEMTWWQELVVTFGVIAIAGFIIWPWFTIPRISSSISQSINHLTDEIREIKNELRRMRTMPPMPHKEDSEEGEL